MTAKLNQIIAIEKGIKARVYGELTELHKAIQKPDLFNGFAKTYLKKEDDGEDLPQERKRAQFVVSDLLRRVQVSGTELMDVTARKDWTNCAATADVIVDDEPILEDVPVSFLLFLEKQLTDMRTFVDNLPVLDEAESWSRDEHSGLFKTEPTQTHRTRKVQKPIVLYPATPEHPAQTQLITEDVIAGFWSQVKQSGAMPKPDKQALATRVEKLLQAVKQAREAANSMDEVETPRVGDVFYGYIFGTTSS